MNTKLSNYGQLRKHPSMETDIANLAMGKRLRRDAALRLERAGLATVGAHDQPVTLSAAGREAARRIAAELKGE